MAKIIKHGQRKFGNLEAQKFQYDVHISGVQGCAAAEGQEVAVCLTRGSKIVLSGYVTAGPNGSAVWNENLSLICTMYRSSTGKFQEKKAKLAVREKKKKKTVGKAHFDLAQYVSVEGTADLTMPLEVSTGVFSDNAASGTMSLRVSCKFIPPGDSGEYSEMSLMDQSSIASTQSDLYEDDEGMEEPKPIGAPQKVGAAAEGSSARNNTVAPAADTAAIQAEVQHSLRLCMS